MYCQIWDYSKSCIDCECIFECENCYHLSLSKKCYSCWYCHELTNCQNCTLCYDCIGCSNCIGCYNLRNKTNYLFNKPSTPEEIRAYTLTHKNTLLSHNTLEKVITQGIHKYASTVQSEDCYGNEFQSSKNCFDCYYMMGSEDCTHCDNGKEEKDCQYVMNGMKNLSNSYCCQTVGINSSNILFTINSTDNLSEIFYSSNIFFGVTKSFGCIALHSHEHHCILNTSYSVQEYETLCSKLVEHMQSTGEWGQFFPRSFSPFEYNESLAQEYFPLPKEDAEKHGWSWRYEEKTGNIENSLTPPAIEFCDEKKVGYETAQKNIEAILDGTVLCKISGKPFKILRQELAFYIENNLPVPELHPDVRHKQMLKLRNTRKIQEGKCSKCEKNIITTYQQGKTFVCGECYNSLVY